MRYIADFHIHSKYSRATSPKMDLEHIDYWARIKGINLMGTGDFTHPLWFKEIKEKLEPSQGGFFKLKNQYQLEPEKYQNQVYFIPTAEISCIYKKNEKTRRIHIVFMAPNLGVVEKINNILNKLGNIHSDGRPILGLDAKKLAQIVLDVSPDCLIIPAHIWTPWFSLFGSNSGFETIEECFEELSPQIYAMETGISSDPAMNWRLSILDRITLISNSDSHSAERIGREANIFEMENFSYQELLRIIKEKDKNRFLYTVEFFPEEGRYHLDGHRVCKCRTLPQETEKNKGLCLICKKPTTRGVLNRVNILADRPEGFKPKNLIPFKNSIPLIEIIADAMGKGVAAKSVREKYFEMIKKGGNEFDILLDFDFEKIKSISDERIASAIIRVREGKVEIEPGYDGEYGKIKIFDKIKEKEKQTKLF